MSCETAYSHVKNLSFPRMVGTKGEKRAFQYVLTLLKDSGLHVEAAPFDIKVIPWHLLNFVLALSAILLCISYMWSPYHPFVSALLTLLIPLLVVLSNSLWGWIVGAAKKCDFIAHRFTSYNIVAREKTSHRKGPVLILTAHYDSKSQTLPLVIRIWATIFFLCAPLFLSISYVIHGIFEDFGPVSGNLNLTILILALICAIVLALNRTENASSGANDNASGAGIILALAQSISRMNLHNIIPIFVFTGAEELGLQGAYSLVGTDYLTQNPVSMCLNLDGVGIKKDLRIIHGTGVFGKHRFSDLTAAIQKAASRAGIGIKSFPLVPGLMEDHIPFAKAGMESVSLSCVGRGTRSIHTSADTISHIDRNAILSTCTLVEQVLRLLDQNATK